MVTTLSRHVTELANLLAEAFDVFNSALYNIALPEVMMQLRNKTDSYGYFQPSQWKSANGERINIISLESVWADDIQAV